MSKQKRVWWIFFLLIFSLCSVNGFTTTLGINPSGVFLITSDQGWIDAGFNPVGRPVYTSNGLTEFWMPIALKKEDVPNLQNKDVEHTILHGNQNFNNRLRDITFEILESDTYWVVLYHMQTLASIKPFNIDFVPKIKGEELTQYAWWNSDWKNYVMYNIDHNLLNSSLTNVPLLFKINDTIGDQCNNGNSVRFVSNDNSTEYKYEIEKWVDNEERICWVNVTSVSNTSDTEILLYYNNSGASDNQDPTNVWDSNYLCVYHMNQSGGSQVWDSTANTNHATYNGSLPTRTGVNNSIGYAQNFDGNGDFIDLPAAVHIDSQGCVMFWYEPGSYDHRHYLFVDNDGTDFEYIHVNDYENPTKDVQTTSAQGAGPIWIASGTNYNLWYQFYALSYGTSNDMYFYLNNSQIYVDVSYTSDTWTPGSGKSHCIGTNRLAGHWANGTLDEYRISDIHRSRSYLNATWQNIGNYDNFFTIGSEASYGIVDAPTGFLVNTTNCADMNLNWTKGTNSSHTSITRKKSSYPSDRSDGTIIYNNTGTTYTDIGLDTESAYYYRAWGYNSTNDTWSAAYAEAYNITSPANPTGVTARVNSTRDELDISWTKNSFADYTVVVYKNNSYPTSVTDGTVLYNGTGTNTSDPNYTSIRYYMVYSYNSTVVCYSSGVQAPQGALVINVYNENTSAAIANWSVFISNSDKTSTYESLTNNNTLTIDVSDLPYGDNTMIRINASGYNFRIYYMDLDVGTYYTLEAYLSEIAETESYIIRVINEKEQPVNDATVYVMRYINDTVGYENISILLTGGYGYCPSSALIPNEAYAVRIEATGYITATYDMHPVTIAYDVDRYFTFMIFFESVEYMNETIYWEIITFNGYISGTSLYVNYTDTSGGTTNTSITVYEHNSSNSSYTVFATDSRIGNNSFQLTYTNINTSNCFELVLDLNHSVYGYKHAHGGILCVHVGITTKTRFDTLLDLNFKHCPFGWSNLFGFFILLGSIFSFGQHNVGISLMFSGGILMFINSVIGLAFLTVTIPVLFIFFGILVLYSEKGKPKGG